MQVQKFHLHSLKLQEGDVTAEVGKRLEAMVEACAAGSEGSVLPVGTGGTASC